MTPLISSVYFSSSSSSSFLSFHLPHSSCCSISLSVRSRRSHLFTLPYHFLSHISFACSISHFPSVFKFRIFALSYTLFSFLSIFPIFSLITSSAFLFSFSFFPSLMFISTSYKLSLLFRTSCSSSFVVRSLFFNSLSSVLLLAILLLFSFLTLSVPIIYLFFVMFPVRAIHLWPSIETRRLFIFRLSKEASSVFPPACDFISFKWRALRHLCARH